MICVCVGVDDTPVVAWAFLCIENESPNNKSLYLFFSQSTS